MAVKLEAVGSQWLKDRYGLERYTLTHSSYIGSNPNIELTSLGNVEETYPVGYSVSPDTPLDHLEFSLKYDDLNLDFLQAVFQHLGLPEVVSYIENRPAGMYARKIGFLYEFLTGHSLDIKKKIGGNYRDLLDDRRYVTGKVIKNTKWRINNNLLGGKEFCPIVRRKRELDSLMAVDISQKIINLRTSYPPEIFHRATQFLYKKETKSSFEIENEVPTEGRVERFMTLLKQAGMRSAQSLLNEGRLIALQQAIVDRRFAASGFRDFQNFIGQTLPNSQQYIHYVCPPPEYLRELMTGLQEIISKTEGVHAAVRAALVSFGFVFIHPFEDGNGRIHRFLIHDILHHDKMVPDNMIIPVSAHMLNHIKDYDAILEKYSSALMQRIKYTQTVDESLTVTNSQEVKGYYQYPDLTEQAIYLLRTILATLDEDMPGELIFLQRYDEVQKEIREIVDMPDRLVNLMILFLHQNNGVFPKRRREKFQMLTDQEIEAMQNAYWRVYEIDGSMKQ